ncbi:hypothetical protein ABID65_003786 [Bradyrhizobium sp. S3.9.2]
MGAGADISARLQQRKQPRMINTYRTADEADRDKAQLVELFEALHASPSVLRRNDDGLWTQRGRPGCYISTWGNGKGWQLVVAPEDEISPLQWTWFKKRLPFCEVTQDGDSEGCFRLSRLPTAAEAEVIRDIIGIRKRMDLSAEAQAERTARLPRRGTG